MSRKTNGKLLQEVLVAVVRLEERMKNYICKNDEDHKTMKTTLSELSKTAGEEMKSVEIRLRKLEDKGLQLSTTIKILIFLAGAIPTVITILVAFKII